MPTYTYECDNCGYVDDIVCKISDRPQEMSCRAPLGKHEQVCEGTMRQVLTPVMVKMSTVQDVPWLRDFSGKRKEARFGKKPIETRQEYHQYLKDNDLRDPHTGVNLTEV